MMQPEGDERGCRKAEFFGPEHACDHHVAARFQLTVGLQADAAPQIVENKRLMRFSNSQFPGNAGVFNARER